MPSGAARGWWDSWTAPTPEWCGTATRRVTRRAPRTSASSAGGAVPAAAPAAASRVLLPGVLLVVLVVLVFANVLGGGFVLDDHFLIEENPRAHSLDGLRFALTTDVQRFQSGAAAPAAYYRPLTLASVVVDYALWGSHPGPFHLANLIAHALAAFLAWRLFTRLFASPWTAAAVAALWAVHPILSESVAWISGRTDPLATCGVLAALLAWLRRREGGGALWLALAAAFTYAACLAKESAMLTPLMALVVERLARRPEPL